MYLSTERLILRDYRGEDLEDLYEILSDPEVMAFCEPVYDRRRTQAVLELFMQKQIACAAVLAGTGKVIGHLLFCPLPPPEEAGVYEMGWFFNRRFWRQGYAQEAAGALIQYGFQTLRLHKICAETIDPVKSVGLMRKLGMTHEETLPAHAQDPAGRWADVYWYAIYSPKEEISE